MKKQFTFVLAIVLCLILSGCSEEVSLSFPFEDADVERIEMFYFIDPTEAEKKVLTEQEDIQNLYQFLSGLTLRDKETEPVAGGSVTSFRFHLSDGTAYEVIYSSSAVKSGRIWATGMDQDYFTSADVGGIYQSFPYEAEAAAEEELPVLTMKNDAESSDWDKIPMVMVDGRLYYGTGEESSVDARCGVMDGEITSSVDGSEVPTKDNQSNFGTGFGYQYGDNDTLEICMNGKWIVFARREGTGNQVRFGDRMVDASSLSKETLAWLEWYNSLAEEERMAISMIPPDLYSQLEFPGTEDAEAPSETEQGK